MRAATVWRTGRKEEKDKRERGRKEKKDGRERAHCQDDEAAVSSDSDGEALQEGD